MSTQVVRYPPVVTTFSVTATNPSVGTTGAAAPTSATEVGMVDGTGKLQGVSSTNPLPVTGTVTAANPSVSATGSAVPASGTYVGMSVAGNLTGLTGTANGLKVDGSAVTQPVSAASLPLPTGAATAAKQPALGTAGSASADVITVQGIASMTALKVDGSAVTQPVSGTVTVQQATGSNLHAVLDAGSSIIGKVGIDQTTPGTTNGVQVNAALPAGSNTIGNVKVTDGTNFMPTMDIVGRAGFHKITDGTNTAAVKAASAAAVATDPALVVAVSPNNTVPVSIAGTASANSPVYNDYTVTSVTTGAYVQLVASTANAISRVEIFDSSGQSLYFATGAAASEVNQFIITPGGNGQVPISIASGTRISVKAVTATANAGYIVVNFYK